MKPQKELITTKLEINEGQFIDIDGYVHYTVDTNYGADADGNRSTQTIDIEEITNINAYDESGDTIELNSEELQLAADALERKFFNN